MWVTTADLPTSAGHPFFERLNRVLEEAGFDAFVEGLCAVFYASPLGLLFIGYFEGPSGDCVAGRGFAEPAGFSGPGRDRGAAEPLDAVAHAASDRTGSRAAAPSLRRPSSSANRRSPSQSCGLAGTGSLRSASATAGADSSAFRMSP